MTIAQSSQETQLSKTKKNSQPIEVVKPESNEPWLHLNIGIPPPERANQLSVTETDERGLDGAFVGFLGPSGARLAGRFAIRPNGVACSWSGSAVSLCFDGSEVAVTISDSGMNRFLVIVDGKCTHDKLRVSPGRRTVMLIDNLPYGRHEVTLYRLTEALLGETVIHGFRLGRGGLPGARPKDPERELLIIGDSISAGYGNEGQGPESPFTPETQNHYLSYGALVARTLAAGLTTVAWSGKGVFSNRGSQVDRLTMSELWMRTLPSTPEARRRGDRFCKEPHAVVINLGTNDFADVVTDISPFGQAYERLVDQVRGIHANAHLFLAVSPTLNDRWPEGRMSRSIMRSTLADVVNARVARGDLKVHYLEFAEISPEEGFGCQWHPTIATHARMALELQDALQRILAWHPADP